VERIVPRAVAEPPEDVGFAPRFDRHPQHRLGVEPAGGGGADVEPGAVVADRLAEPEGIDRVRGLEVLPDLEHQVGLVERRHRLQHPAPLEPLDPRRREFGTAGAGIEHQVVRSEPAPGEALQGEILLVGGVRRRRHHPSARRSRPGRPGPGPPRPTTRTGRRPADSGAVGFASRSGALTKAVSNRPRSQSQKSLTWRFWRAVIRWITPRFDQRVMLQPTAQAVQVDSTAVISHGRLLKRNSRVVSAPTGQTSATLPEKGSVSSTPGGVSISVLTPRAVSISWLLPEMSWVNRVQRQQRMQRSASKMMCGPSTFRFGRWTLGSRSRLPPPRML